MNWIDKLNSSILIVDDSIESLEILAKTLQDSLPECTIYQTNSANSALTIAIEMNPDLIITDWDMPCKSGIDLVQSIKEDALTKEIPVIMLTGINCNADDLKRAFEAGAVDYMRKPFDKTELLARIHSALTINNEHLSDINSKNRELIQGALHLEKSHEFLHKLKTELKAFAETAVLRKKDSAQISSIIELVEDRASMNSWTQFELLFKSAHPFFVKKLLSDFPGMSMSEIKLCSLIKLNMSIKNIAYILHQKPESVKVSRSRLRKKLGLEHSQNLNSFLAQY